MLDVIYRVLPVVLVFLTDALYAWVWGGTRVAPLLEWMPWISLLSMQVLFFFPQRHPWEDSVMARQRTWESLARDPLTWTALAFIILLVIPLFNKGLCPNCDFDAIVAGADPRPPLPFLPWCVDVADHAWAFMWFVPGMIAALAVRHALVKRGRRLFMELLVWNGALLAVYGFILNGIGALGPYGDPIVKRGKYYFFSTFGYPNMAGSYFVFLCAVSVGMWRMRWFETGRIAAMTRKDVVKPRNLWFRGNYPIVAAVLNFFGALSSLSRAAIISAFVIVLVTFVYIFSGMFAHRRRERLRNVKGAAWAGLGMLVFIAMVYVFAPVGMEREIKSMSTFEVLDRVSGKGTYHTRVSTAIFKDYPFFGVGCWGYKHLCMKYLKPEEVKSIQWNGGANVHNDYLQFLCEFGSVGTGLIVAIFVMLILPVVRDWYHFYNVSKFTRPEDASVNTLVFYSLPPPIFWTFVGLVLVLVHAMGDCPLRSGAVMSALLTALASTEGFLPDYERPNAVLRAAVVKSGGSLPSHEHPISAGRLAGEKA